MQKLLVSNPIYQHSGETEKSSVLAQQACVNEDQEQRRRQLDKRGEQQKMNVAREVAQPSKPILEQAQQSLQHAQHATAGVLSSALEAGKSILSQATATAGAVAGAAASAVQNIAHSTLDSASSAINTATSVGHDAAIQLSSSASTITAKVVDSTSTAAGVVSQKTKEIAHVATDKAFEIADNISHFTTLVGVLAEEENERARRMVSGDEARAAANAFRVSELIRDLGDDFLLEECERRWRLNSRASDLIEGNAHREGKLVKKNLQSFMPRYQWARTHICTLEEKERLRRMNDPAEAYAIINALNIAFIIRELGLGFYRQEGTFGITHASYATTLLEENERRDRIRTDKLLHAEESHPLLSSILSTNIEKFNYSTRNAAKFANAMLKIKTKFLAHLNRYVHGPPNFLWKQGTIHEFATLLGNATMRVASQFSSLTKDLANTAAERVKTVAGDLKNFSTVMYVIALEEKERTRRLSDPDEITAINNAWFQSQLIRDLSALYKPAGIARYPLGLIEETEKRWRMASVTPNASRTVASFVRANLQKFELATQRAAERERVHSETISHSRLNPRAPAFVPHQALLVKVEPAYVAPRNVASGAQL